MVISVLMICIDACVFGTTDHVVVDDAKNIVHTNNIPEQAWHFSGDIKRSNRCFDTLLKLGQISVSIDPPQRFVSAMRSLTKTERFPWKKIMPAEAHKNFIETLATSAMDAMAQAPVSYCENTWVNGTTVLDALQPMKIDVSTWQDLVQSRKGNVTALATFEPDQQGFAQLTKYDRFGTRTGRMTVADGADILTLKKDHRKIIRSRFGDEGCIVMLDFAALEVRVLLYEAGGSYDDPDLYSSVAKKLFDNKIKRDHVKRAMIAEVYGQKKYMVGKSLGIQGKQLNDFMSSVKSLFKIDNLKNRIKAEHVKLGHIKNRYGRCLKIDHPLDHLFINTYSQSTGVDVAMSGFAMIIKDCASDDIIPVAIIHDAILFDIKRSHVHKFKEHTTIRVPGYVQNFFVKTEML